jgi:uncharacterized membrane protein YbhN (UPF0104 family)
MPRRRGRLRGRRGWRGALGTFLDSIHLIRELFIHPRRWGLALLGMVVFWAADVFAVWAGLAAFGFGMTAAALIVGFATGMVFTRRTGPLGGAGILALVLPVTIWGSGAPLAVAAVGVLAYRALSLWLPMSASLAFLPTLWEMGEHRIPQAEANAGSRHEARLDRRSG